MLETENLFPGAAEPLCRSKKKVNEHERGPLARAPFCAQTKYLLTMGTRLSSAETKKDSVPMSSVRSGTEKKALQESVLTPRN